MPVTDVYEGRATAWARGAERIYGPLAEQLVAMTPVDPRGLTALDVGSGTGAVARAAQAAGARVVTVDRSPDMATVTAGHWPTATADAAVLPFCEGSFDLLLSGFVLNHLEPSTALGESARVLDGDGVLVATTWKQGSDPVKTAIDGVLRAFGWVPPDWYVDMMQAILPVSGDPRRLATAARCAGFGQVTATVRAVALGSLDPSSVVGYRLALPHVAPWAASLDEDVAARMSSLAREAVAGRIATWRPRIIVLIARAARQAKRSARRSSASR